MMDMGQVQSLAPWQSVVSFHQSWDMHVHVHLCHEISRKMTGTAPKIVGLEGLAARSLWISFLDFLLFFHHQKQIP